MMSQFHDTFRLEQREREREREMRRKKKGNETSLSVSDADIKIILIFFEEEVPFDVKRISSCAQHTPDIPPPIIMIFISLSFAIWLRSWVSEGIWEEDKRSLFFLWSIVLTTSSSNGLEFPQWFGKWKWFREVVHASPFSIPNNLEIIDIDRQSTEWRWLECLSVLCDDNRVITSYVCLMEGRLAMMRHSRLDS